MNKSLAVLTIFLAILYHSEAAAGQNITSATPPGDAILEANGSSASSSTESNTEVSPQASAEAKRLYREAVKYKRGGLLKQASQLYEKAIQLNPNYADAHYDLGYAYFEQGRWEDAIRSFENALRINPKDKKTRAGLDEARVLAGKTTEPAQPSKEKIAAADPISTSSWLESRSRNVTPASVTPPSVEQASIAPASVAPASVTPASVEPASVEPANVAPPSVTPASVETASVTPRNAEPAGVPASPGVTKNARADHSSLASTTKDDLTRLYHIGVGDVLDVRLGNETANQSTLFTVTPSGLLEHPILAAPLQVSGLTVDETQARLEADLKRRAVNEKPRVSVGVREYLSHAIIVSGLVKDPGTKLLRREAIPLYVVIGDAQPAPEAGRATVISHETGETVVVDISKPAEMNRLIRPGDVITVHANPKEFFYVGGEVKAPGEKQFRPGLTLTQAILTAGGLSRESRKAHIARASENGLLVSTSYKLKDINAGKLADPLIQAGDRITVEH